MNAFERYKNIAWSVASSIAATTGGDSVLIYKRLINKAQEDFGRQIQSQVNSQESK